MGLPVSTLLPSLFVIKISCAGKLLVLRDWELLRGRPPPLKSEFYHPGTQNSARSVVCQNLDGFSKTRFWSSSLAKLKYLLCRCTGPWQKRFVASPLASCCSLAWGACCSQRLTTAVSAGLHFLAPISYGAAPHAT